MIKFHISSYNQCPLFRFSYSDEKKTTNFVPNRVDYLNIDFSAKQYSKHSILIVLYKIKIF